MKFTGLDQLKTGTKILVQFAIRDNEDGDAPDWKAPTPVSLYVLRREKPLKRGRTVYPAGQILILTVKDRNDWVEYSESDYSPEYQTFGKENYRMRILEVLE